MGERLAGGAVRTHTTFIGSVCRLIRVCFVAPKTMTIVTSKMADHHHKYKNEKSLNHCENYQNVTQGHKVSKYCSKNGPGRLVQCRLATDLQFAKNAVSVKPNEAKYNKAGMPGFVLYFRCKKLSCT